MTNPVVVGITGASGAVMARSMVDALLRRDIPTVALCSNAGRLVWQEEMGEHFNDTLIEWQEHPAFTHYPINDLRAPVASGTYPTAGMVIMPASMNSIASLAGGLSGNLLLRTADVCLKERRPLVLVPRETPLHSIHLNNMLTLSRMGAMVVPPEPAFYLKPQSLNDIVDFVVARVFVALGLDQAMPENMQYLGPEGELD
ncbi:MAG: UbiX family flavin prenyltransferase [Dehalococcoidia bacterium]|jgi:4-hydroxy-3-polyprenylbenzoate decarboxylase|nr:UbiX family flavin prenyltransferase [Dehalococcoidia bacterium]